MTRSADDVHTLDGARRQTAAAAQRYPDRRGRRLADLDRGPRRVNSGDTENSAPCHIDTRRVGNHFGEQEVWSQATALERSYLLLDSIGSFG